jgi:hypothetical protein
MFQYTILDISYNISEIQVRYNILENDEVLLERARTFQVKEDTDIDQLKAEIDFYIQSEIDQLKIVKNIADQLEDVKNVSVELGKSLVNQINKEKL